MVLLICNKTIEKGEKKMTYYLNHSRVRKDYTKMIATILSDKKVALYFSDSYNVSVCALVLYELDHFNVIEKEDKVIIRYKGKVMRMTKDRENNSREFYAILHGKDYVII